MERVPVTAPAQIPEERPEEERDRRLARVHRQVSRGEYVVNSQNVAAAILERIGATFGEPEPVSEGGGGRSLMRALSFPPGT